MLDQPLESIDRYIEAFSAGPLPVLRRSLRALAALRADEAHLNGRTLAAEVLRDPMLALQVLTHLEQNRPARQNHDITTVERALIMMGMEPFFTHFGDLPSVEDTLGSQPHALVGLLRVAGRAQHAAAWARRFAVLRHDIDVDEVTVAALLHEAAEVLFWCFAPVLMQRINALLVARPELRSAQAQEIVLGVPILDVQLALTRAWHLPTLLIALMNDEQADSPRVRNVRIACDLARHASRGWDNPALAPDFTAAADLLHLRPSAVMEIVGAPDTVCQAAREAEAASPS
ncbi:MAG: HDOD domain-containing protein [Candidatus Dactylopiibacterium sp.]|nr:HDOD domain-containing protein [Candidatus Dactylopiibacterium sp.]